MKGGRGVWLPGAPTAPDHAALLQCCCCTASVPAAPSETARDSHVKDHKSLVHGAYTHTHTHTHTHCSTWSLPYSVLGYPLNAVESVAREVQDPQSPVSLQSLDTLQLAAAQGELVNC